MSPKNDRGAHPEIGRGGSRGKDLQLTNLWVVPVLREALLEGFFYEGILFTGSVDLNRVLIRTKSTNLYSC